MNVFIALNLLLFANLYTVVPSDTVSLQQLHDMATKQWPMSAESQRTVQVNDLKMDQLVTVWLPEIHLNATAQYHSEVTTIPFSVPGFSAPSQPHERFSVSLDMQQVIWDGGMSRGQKDLLQKSMTADQSRISAEVYQIKDQVNEVFFSILILNYRLESMYLLDAELSERISQLEIRSTAGVVLTTQVDLIKLEQLRIRQSTVELVRLRNQAYNILAILTGYDFSGNEVLIAEEIPQTQQRPELQYLSDQQELLRAKQHMLNATRMPRISAFGQLSVGRPGPDIFNDEIRPFYVVGVQGRWRVWDWGNTRREKQIIDLNIKTINDQKGIFLQAQSIKDATLRSRISAIQDQLSLDDEIIEMRSKVLNTYENQLLHGTITSTEYLIEFNATHQAKLHQKIRQVDLLKHTTLLKTLNYNPEN